MENEGELYKKLTRIEELAMEIHGVKLNLALLKEVLDEAKQEFPDVHEIAKEHGSDTYLFFWNWTEKWFKKWFGNMEK